jgi:hypothetical protein
LSFRARILWGLTFVTAAHPLPAQGQAQPGYASAPGGAPPSTQSAFPPQPAPSSNALQAPSQNNPPTRQPENPQDPTPTPPVQSVPGTSEEATTPSPPSSRPDAWAWLDRTRQGVYDALWHSAMRVDRWFGSQEPESEYRKVYGSIAPAVLWDRHYGFSEPFRFNVNLPLPQIDQRFHAFVGRFDPNELITESSEPSGAFRRQYGPVTQDQTLFGLAFHQPPKQGGYFDAGAGVRITLPFDPYVKGSYVYARGASELGLFSVRETAFWQHSQGFGVTSRMDTERIYNLRWLARLTGSVTVSERSQGVLWWSAVDFMRGLAARRALALEIESDGQTDAPVPLHNYGAKFAYRQSVLRKWLIMELRTSVSWPKDLPAQDRRLSPGLGIGFEMLFGTDQFLARPVTF